MMRKSCKTMFFCENSDFPEYFEAGPNVDECTFLYGCPEDDPITYETQWFDVNQYKNHLYDNIWDVICVCGPCDNDIYHSYITHPDDPSIICSENFDASDKNINNWLYGIEDFPCQEQPPLYLIALQEDIEITSRENKIDNNKSSIEVYPNPTSNRIFIQSDELIKNIKIYNIIGNLKKSYFLNTDKFDLDLTELEPAVYILEININNEKFFKQIVKI